MLNKLLLFIKKNWFSLLLFICGLIKIYLGIKNKNIKKITGEYNKKIKQIDKEIDKLEKEKVNEKDFDDISRESLISRIHKLLGGH